LESREAADRLAIELLKSSGSDGGNRRARKPLRDRLLYETSSKIGDGIAKVWGDRWASKVLEIRRENRRKKNPANDIQL
jgi:hypothetical protein